MKSKKCFGKKFAAVIGAAAFCLFAESTSVIGVSAREAEAFHVPETADAADYSLPSAGDVNSSNTTDTTETADALNPTGMTQPEQTVISADSVTISLAGDCSLGKLSIHGYSGTFHEMYDLYGASYFFQNVKDIFAADDMTLVNFEGVLTKASTPTPKQFNIRGKPEFNQILVEGNIDAVSFGNNHNMDYGLKSTQDTIAAFAQVGIPYACNDTPGVYETDSGVRIGFVSVNEVYDGAAVETYLQNGIAALQAQETDLILACCHWGEEMEHYPESYQTELGHKCIDWGADLVVGCHPHVLQGIEQYNGKYIIYSLGNFCFGGNKNPKNKDTVIVQAVFPVTEGTVSKEARLKIIPCTISSVPHRNDYCPTPADPERAASILQKMNTYSEPFGTITDQTGIVTQIPVPETANPVIG